MNNYNQSTYSSLETSSITRIMLRLCRMSWFLVQQLQHSNILSIIHSVDLVDDITHDDIGFNKIVKYYRDESIIEAKMICASDNRQFVEDELKKRLFDANRVRYFFPEYIPLDLQIQGIYESWFFIQFSRNENCIVHSVLRGSEIPWLIRDNNLNSREILIDDDNVKRLATVLHYSNDEEDLMQLMILLKSKYAYLTFDDSISIKSFKWLLVQYSDSLNNVIHSVINENDTILDDINKNPCDYITYIKDKSNLYIYQARILKRAAYFNDLENELIKIKEKILLSKFPVQNGYNEMAMGVNDIDDRSFY